MILDLFSNMLYLSGGKYKAIILCSSGTDESSPLRLI